MTGPALESYHEIWELPIKGRHTETYPRESNMTGKRKLGISFYSLPFLKMGAVFGDKVPILVKTKTIDPGF